MLFSGIPFLYYFLPCVLILYLISPKRLKNFVLLISSLFFYAWGEPKYIILMILSIIFGYIFGLLIERFRTNKLSKAFMILSVVSFLAVLGWFKYVDFFISNFNLATGLSVPLLKLALPIGISFYTFQLLSYTVDVYLGNVSAQKNPISLAVYVSLFPQLIAGPIVRYSDIASQLDSRTHSVDKLTAGAQRFLIGLGKKVLIANTLGELCDVFRNTTDSSVMFFWLYAVAFTLHIYFDFSGYSDMAIGLGKIFGFHFMENFNYPYISGSITEFWRRWHISLGSWFRDYVYIPLGGNRVSKPRWLFNILIVWMLTGFWHGASWNFILWGLYFAVLLVIEKLWLLKYLEKTKVIKHVYVVLCVILGFVLFNASGLDGAKADFKGMFGMGEIPFVSHEFFYYLRNYAIILILGIIGATPLIRKMIVSIKNTKITARMFIVLEPIALSLLLLVVTAYLVDGSFNPFLYFRF